MAYARCMTRKDSSCFSFRVILCRRLVLGTLAVLLGVVQPINAGAQSVETLHFLDEALHAGPGTFVDFMHEYGAGRLHGESHEEAQGAAAGSILGGLVGMGLARGHGQGVVGTIVTTTMFGAVGRAAGRAYGLHQSHEQLDQIFSEWQSERTPLATELKQRLEACLQESDLSWCAAQPEIVKLKQQIAEINHTYCEMAAPHLHNPKGGMIRCTASNTK